MLETLPNDLIETITSHLSIKQRFALRCVSKAFGTWPGDEIQHTYQVLRYDKGSVTLPTVPPSDELCFNTSIETLSRIFRNRNISKGLKSKLRYYIHKKEHLASQTIRIDPILTNEQIGIVQIPFDPNTVVMVQAYAGTGKTKTLVEYAKHHSHNRILYLAYNKELCEDAKQRFGGLHNVHVSTIHAIAFPEFEDYDVGDLNIHDLIRIYDVSHLEALKYQREFDLYCHKVQEHSNTSQMIWNDMFVTKKIPLSHDAYLKQFQLSNPTLAYDIIMLDEVQDCNDCILEIVGNQKTMKIYVGDLYQKLYGFRNVDNPFSYITKNKKEHESVVRRTLSVSFRLGFDLMYHVNMFLQHKFDIRGFSRSNATNTQILPNSDIEIETTGEKATYICRYNINVMRLAFRFVSQEKTIYVYGKQFDFDKEMEVTKDFIRLTEGYVQDIVHEECKGDSIEDLKHKYNELCMQEWRQRATLFTEYGTDLLTHWENMKRLTSATSASADVMLTTVHQAKGSEFDNVCLYEDITINNQDSLFVMYVAMTRARKRLKLNPLMTAYFLKQKGSQYCINTDPNRCKETKKCVTCDNRTNQNVWKDVDFSSHFNEHPSQLSENQKMCVKCQMKQGLLKNGQG
jgi:F-box protein, helicase, 18